MDHQQATSEIDIDWQAVKERLARSEIALSAIEELSPAQSKRLMDQRAELLARVPDEAPDASEVIEVMIFKLGKERMAIETQYVHEVVRPNDITPLPGSPEFMVGFTNLRGEVISVMDLRHFFGGAEDTSDGGIQVLILGKEQVQFGIVADLIEEVGILRQDAIHDPPGAIKEAGRELLRGVTSDAMLVLQGESLMSADELYIDQIDM